MGVQLHAFLISALDGSEWSASHPDCFTPDERDTGMSGEERKSHHCPARN